jgi:FkbM family methyltransferase
LLEGLREFTFDNYTLLYPSNALDEAFWFSLCENLIVDVYRSSEFVKENDVVLDLGASIGSFSVVASKTVGNKGKVIAIEPDIHSFKILKRNIERNNCPNIIPLNMGVAGKPGEGQVTFSRRTYKFKVNSLENILRDLNITDKVGFIKMDIEGFEDEVVRESIHILKHTDAISLEFHGTKQKLDEVLVPNGFCFKPLTMGYIYKNLLKNLFLHPIDFCKAAFNTVRDNPQVIHSIVSGFRITRRNVSRGDETFVGVYFRDRF